MAQSDTAAVSLGKRTVVFGAQLFSSPAGQKLLAFGSLIVLVIYFAFASPAFLHIDNIIGILQSTAVNGVLAIASTFVIITGGIDLSVGCLMTFCAVAAGMVLSSWHLPLWISIVARSGSARSVAPCPAPWWQSSRSRRLSRRLE